MTGVRPGSLEDPKLPVPRARQGRLGRYESSLVAVLVAYRHTPPDNREAMRYKRHVIALTAIAFLIWLVIWIGVAAGVK